MGLRSFLLGRLVQATMVSLLGTSGPFFWCFVVLCLIQAAVAQLESNLKLVHVENDRGFTSTRTFWCISSVLTIVTIIATWSFIGWKRKANLIGKIPGPASFLVLGNLNVLFELRKYEKILSTHTLLLQTMCGLAELYDSARIFRFWLGPRPVVAFFKPETVEVLLNSNKHIDKSFDYTLLYPWLGTGLLTSCGKKWRPRRKMLTPAFHFRILEDFVPIFNEQARIFTSLLEKHVDRNPVDIVPFITNCTLDIICETAMGVKIGAQSNSESHYVRALYEVGKTFIYRVVRPWLWFPLVFLMTAKGRRFQDNLQDLHNFTRKVIQERKAEIQSEKCGKEERKGTTEIPDAAHIRAKKRKAFLDLLLTEHLENNSLSLEDIREEVDTFMFEGHDTTAMGIAWSLYLIGLHAEVQDRIHDELDFIFGEDRERDFTTEDLKNMKYLECAIKEAQRLFPSVPFIGRELKEDVVVNGFTVPKGTTCFVFTYMLHRDKRTFPNPEAFIPERFLPENSIGRHPFAYVPFSAGPRNCIGQKFALMEEKLLCATILRRCQIQSVHHRDHIRLKPELVIRPEEGLRVRVRLRPPSTGRSICSSQLHRFPREPFYYDDTHHGGGTQHSI